MPACWSNRRRFRVREIASAHKPKFKPTRYQNYGLLDPPFRRSLVLRRPLSSNHAPLVPFPHPQSARRGHCELPRLDAEHFDFFILVFVLKDVAQEFQTDVETVTYAIFLTLAARPVGALLFGLAADRFGRRPVLMIDILLFSMLEFASGLAPSLTIFLILRLAFGVAMGGEWGVGAALAMETIPAGTRGVGLGNPPDRLSERLSARRDHLFRALWTSRLARHVHGRRPAGAARFVYSRQGRGIAGFFGARPRKTRRWSRHDAARQRRTVPLCRIAHDRIQLFESWDAGPLPDFPATPTSFFAAYGRHHRDRL